VTVRQLPRHLQPARFETGAAAAATGVLIETPLMAATSHRPLQHERAAHEIFAVSRALAGLADAATRHGPCDLHPDNQALATLPTAAPGRHRPGSRTSGAVQVRLRHRYGGRLARWHLEDAPPGYVEIWLETRPETAPGWPSPGPGEPARHAWWAAVLGHWLARRGLPWQWTHQEQPWTPGSSAVAGGAIGGRAWSEYHAALTDIADAWLTDLEQFVPTPITARRGRRAALHARARQLIRAQAIEPAAPPDGIPDDAAAEAALLTDLIAALTDVAAALQHTGRQQQPSFPAAEHSRGDLATQTCTKGHP
jgi:hypothetical protein